MKLRVIAVCTLLLLAAVPSFALPQCAVCNEYNECDPIPGSYERCLYDAWGCCFNDFGRCSVPYAAETTVLTDWKVTTIEISRPSLDSVTITAPAPLAEAPAATSELK